ncbi:MAG: ring-cleaving dioxygenase [Thermomicrobia bacterium]|nr:ring-cleaving dioxygenase [Thermomicrobia bacterium]MCA1722824.1 ring-cleaving dioxygenase [Thermomicrobia bacterium]
MELSGIHHMTAVTGDASRNVAFYTQVLGMRLVKKTVNQDDVSAYHLFYADGVGSPGTDLTFFDWPQAGPTRPGVGTTTTTALRVPGRAALDWWAARLEKYGVPHSSIVTMHGRARIAFTDPEGQSLALVDDGGAPFTGAAWQESSVPPEMAVRGFDSVSLAVRTLAPTVRVLTEVLGFRQTDEEVGGDGAARIVFETGAGGPGATVSVTEQQGLPYASVGIGGVHHIAFRTPDDAEQRAWRERIAAAGLRVTPEIDRFYFRSIYFREPGGVLFEIATDGPGFATDEPVASLGASLALPPFLEGRRAAIEAGLRPITPPDLVPVHR